MGTMAGMEPLQRLFQRGAVMIQETSDSFEQHFLWLEEVVAEARQTLATSELVMLPKTPSAPKRTKGILREDAVNMPPPVSARPSRHCSKLASERIQEQTRMSRVKKLRRPSSPINQVMPSTAIKAKTHKNLHFEVSPSPSSPGDEMKSPASRSECAMSSSPRSSYGNSKEAIKPRRLSTPQKDTSSPKKHSISLQNDENTSSQNSDSSTQNLVSSEREVTFQHKEGTTSPKHSTHQNHSSPPPDSGSLHIEASSATVSSDEVVSKSPYISPQCINAQDNTEKNLVQEEGADNKSQKNNSATVEPEVHPQDHEEIHLQLDESVEECASADDSEEEQDIELVLESSGQKSKSSTNKKRNDSPVPNNILQVSSVSAPIATCSKKEVVEIPDMSSTSDSLPQSHCAPAPRGTHTKQGTMAPQDASSSSDSCPQSPTVCAPRVTRTKQKMTKVQEIPTLSDSPPEVPAAPVTRVTRTKQRVLETQNTVPPPISVPQPFAPAPRVTRTKQRAIEAQDDVLPQENDLQPSTAPAPRVTRTKTRAMEKELPPSSPNLPQPFPRVTRTKQKDREMEPPVSSEEPTTMRPTTEDKDKDKIISRIIQHQPLQSPGRGVRHTVTKDSGMFSLGTKRASWSSVESLSSEESSTRPVRITRSKMSKLQQPHLSPGKVPASENFPRACHSPVGSVRSHSPSKGSPANRRLAGQSSRDGGKGPMTTEVLLSPLRVVRHSPDKMGKVLQARPPVVNGSSGRVTPNIISRMQPFLSSSSSSSSTEHRKIVKKIVGTPSDTRRPANIVGGVTSFIKTQPTRPTREDMEKVRLQELQRKKEYEEETLRKKEQLLWAKAEERKRCNEERMRRAKEARLKKEQMAAAAKEQQQLERQQREARQREEEQEQQRRLRQQQLAKKKVEEAKKAAKLKEEEERKKQEEEERRRQKLEEEKRRQKILEERRQKLEQEEKKLEEERKNFLAKQKNALEEQKKLKEARAQMLMKEKEEAEQLKLKESLRILKEKEMQAKREQETKTVLSNAYTHNTHTTPLNKTITKESNSGPLNTTYTKPAGSVQTNSYEMTPFDPPRSSHSLNNYDMHSMQSDDSTDDEDSPRKRIPPWALKTKLQAALLRQEHYPPKVDEIFPAISLLIIPDLTRMFRQQKRRFKKRTSSAIWETPPSKYFRYMSPK